MAAMHAGEVIVLVVAVHTGVPGGPDPAVALGGVGERNEETKHEGASGKWDQELSGDARSGEFGHSGTPRPGDGLGLVPLVLTPTGPQGAAYL